MLKPIPSVLLKDSAVIRVCTGTDSWQKPTFTETAVANVHLQNTNEVKKTKDNTEVVLRSILFIDGKRSLPALDYDALMRTSEANGQQMRVTVYGPSGDAYGDYAVVVCDPVPDIPSSRVHHVELSLV